MSDYYVCGYGINVDGDLVRVLTDGKDLFLAGTFGVDAYSGFGFKFSKLDDDANNYILRVLSEAEIQATLYVLCEGHQVMICNDDLPNIDNYRVFAFGDYAEEDGKLITRAVDTDKFDVYCVDESSQEFFDIMEAVEWLGV